MEANSRPVTSNQKAVHARLAQVVRRHLQTTYQGTVASHNRQAFAVLTEALQAQPRPLVLDSFCGTGHSTARLAERHPKHLVVGIDKSANRLGKHPGGNSDNYLLLNAECEDIWTLLVEHGHVVDYHYLFYPNPWPKARQLQRRVHGDPRFPQLLRLGGRLELRSNWLLYVEEFGTALNLAGYPGRVAAVSDSDPAISLFEEKYRRSGHTLWSFTARIAYRDDFPVIG